jgi:hypothetical protein
MKLTKYLVIIALFGTGLFVSCTPEAIEDDQTEQQVDATKIQPPRQG